MAVPIKDQLVQTFRATDILGLGKKVHEQEKFISRKINSVQRSQFVPIFAPLVAVTALELKPRGATINKRKIAGSHEQVQNLAG